MPMESLIKKLSLSDSMKSALLKQEGEIGAILDYVIQYQQDGGNHAINKKALADNIAIDNIHSAYLESVKWVEENRQASP